MIELYLTAILKSLILPPGGLLLLWLLGLLLLRRHAFLGRSLLWAGFGLAYLVSMPLVSGLLQQQLQSYPALTAAQIAHSPAQAIVVLSADRYKDAPEYGVDTVGNHTLVRIRYAAYLHRMTKLPVLVSGGHVFDQEGDSLARVMADSLLQDFGIDEVWLDDRSRNTSENARFSREVLQDKGIDTIYLVTHAIHMPRALASFEQTGLKVIPAPTRFHQRDAHWFMLWLPNAGAMVENTMALHEIGGRLWYSIRY